LPIGVGARLTDRWPPAIDASLQIRVVRELPDLRFRRPVSIPAESGSAFGFGGQGARIHHSTDIASYEFASAARREQYFGEMHWDLAWPLLQKRIGGCEA
jgi:hypothetical protein